MVWLLVGVLAVRESWPQVNEYMLVIVQRQLRIPHLGVLVEPGLKVCMIEIQDGGTAQDAGLRDRDIIVKLSYELPRSGSAGSFERAYMPDPGAAKRFRSDLASGVKLGVEAVEVVIYRGKGEGLRPIRVEVEDRGLEPPESLLASFDVLRPYTFVILLLPVLLLVLIGAAVLGVSGVVVLLGFHLAVKLVPKIVRSGAWGFGGENVSETWLTRIFAESLPSGRIDEVRPSWTWGHSAIHGEESTAQEVAQWIKGLIDQASDPQSHTRAGTAPGRDDDPDPPGLE